MYTEYHIRVYVGGPKHKEYVLVFTPASDTIYVRLERKQDNWSGAQATKVLVDDLKLQKEDLVQLIEKFKEEKYAPNSTP